MRAPPKSHSVDGADLTLINDGAEALTGGQEVGNGAVEFRRPVHVGDMAGAGQFDVARAGKLFVKLAHRGGRAPSFSPTRNSTGCFTLATAEA